MKDYMVVKTLVNILLIIFKTYLSIVISFEVKEIISYLMKVSPFSWINLIRLNHFYFSYKITTILIIFGANLHL